MSWSSWFAVVIGLGGLVIGVLNTLAALSDVRAKRFFSRATSLLKLRDVMAGEGPLQGKNTSAMTEDAHDELLSQLEREARANTILYLNAAARLAKPGSLIVGVGELVYGVLVGWVAFHPLPWTTATDATNSVVAASGKVTLLLIAIVVVALGAQQIVRRVRTRALRKRVGTLDDLTIEGSAWIRNIPNAVSKKWARDPDPNGTRPTSGESPPA